MCKGRERCIHSAFYKQALHLSRLPRYANDTCGRMSNQSCSSGATPAYRSSSSSSSSVNFLSVLCAANVLIGGGGDRISHANYFTLIERDLACVYIYTCILFLLLRCSAPLLIKIRKNNDLCHDNREQYIFFFTKNILYSALR